MSFSLPGFNLFYLSRDNLEPEKYELITRPSVTWDYIRQEFEFDDRYRDHYHVEGLKPRPTSFALSSFGGTSTPASEPTYKTINSKSAGRLLAAGGVYNGNAEGFRKTAEQLGGDAVKGYDQVLNEQTAGTAIAAASILLAKRLNPQLYDEMTSYLGKLRGESRLVNGITITDINYTKRNPAEAALLRKEFDSTVRKEFVKEIAATPDAANIFSPSQLLRMNSGKSPDGWDVHHKLPLDDGGTNSFNNLVLIEKEPYHKIFTNMQRSAAKNLVPGESRVTPWAIPTGSIYPLK
ncbi:TPA: HNH endonuclease [Enterobacter sichuanensis]|nr:HNH endonuclease [Enterobacter sichuanensis]